MIEMARIVNPETGEITDVTIGDRLYHWRYGPLTIVSEEDARIEAHLDDHDGIIEEVGDPWNSYLHDEKKWWPVESLGQWLFSAPEDVGRTAALATHAISDGDFVRRLHRGYDRAAIIDRSPISRALRAEIMAKATGDALAEKEPRLAELTRAVQDHRAEIEAQETGLAGLQQDLDRLCKQTDAKRATLLGLESEQTPAIRKENQPRIKPLKDEIIAAEGETKNLSSRIAEAEKKVGDLLKLRDAAETQRAALANEVSALESQLAQLLTEMDERR